MNVTHFQTVDLNLLRVFEALLSEGSATRAGSRLGLSQSAVSHALGRLRQAVGDELFVRGPIGLTPTPRALELGGPIRAALKALESAMTGPGFDPASTERQFVVGATAYACTVLLPRVVQMMMVEAPHARLRVRGETSLADELARGSVDMIIGAFEDVPPRFAYTPLFDETLVWVIRSDHPALARGNDATILEDLTQVALAADEDGDHVAGGPRSITLRRVSAQNAYRLKTSAGNTSPILTVPDTYSALAMVLRTDMVGLLPRRLAIIGAQNGRLTLINPPTRPATEVGAVVRAGEAERGPISWLLGLMRTAAAEI